MGTNCVSWRPTGSRTLVVAFGGIVVVALAEILRQRFRLPLVIDGVRDEAAHFATAALLLAAVCPWAPRRLLVSALCAAVLMDVDHLPAYLTGNGVWMHGVGRPYPHSLAAPIAFLAGFALTRWLPLAGVALGTLLHLVRDVATGPGVPLLWPVSHAMVRCPYTAYTALLVAAVVVIALRSNGFGASAGPPGACPRSRSGAGDASRRAPASADAGRTALAGFSVRGGVVRPVTILADVVVPCWPRCKTRRSPRGPGYQRDRN